jgi:predicted PurR-regulated permease PerM
VRPEQEPGQRAAVDLAVRLGLLAVFAYYALTLVRPFLPLLLWSVILTVAFYPVYSWLRARFGGRSWPAALSLTCVAVAIVVGPTTILLASLIESLEVIGRHLGGGRLDLPPTPKVVVDLPMIGDQLQQAWVLASTNLEGFLARYSKPLLNVGEWTLHAVAGLAGSVLLVLAAVIISGFLYGPAPRLAADTRTFAARVIGARGAAFVDLAGVTIRNVARGVIGVALIQALLIGFGLIVAEVPAAGLLTLAVLVLGILQIGSGPVLIPLLVWAWATRDTMPAMLLTLYMIPAGLIDNVLKPLLMGKGLGTPVLVILAGVIGGTISHGLIGLFLGPVVLAVFYDLLRFWVAADGATESDRTDEAGGTSAVAARRVSPRSGSGDPA